MKPLIWLLAIVTITAFTMLFTYFIPVDSPFVYLRYTFGIIFVVIVPGYCLINILFRKRNKLDLVEQAVLSVALSFGLLGLTGLFLGLTPIKLNFSSITVSVTGLTLLLAVIAFILMIKKPSEQNSTDKKSFF